MKKEEVKKEIAIRFAKKLENCNALFTVKTPL
jgi:hypothetical protein